MHQQANFHFVELHISNSYLSWILGIFCTLRFMKQCHFVVGSMYVKYVCRSVPLASGNWSRELLGHEHHIETATSTHPFSRAIVTQPRISKFFFETYAATSELV